MKKVTIKEVAKAAGVSTMTVSRVLNDRPDVSAATRSHVQEVIAELGYRPSAVARSLIQGQSRTLGIVAFGLDYYGPSSTLVGIERRADEMGYSLLVSLIHTLQTDHEVQKQTLDNLLSHQVDGIIWAVAEHEDNRDWLCEQAAELYTPIVFVNMQPRPGTTVVAVDNYEGGRLAASHLFDRGYRRVAIITGPLNWWEAQQRKAGWCDALREAGLSECVDKAVAGDWSAASGEEGMRQLLEQYPSLEAVFASNDQMALGALQAARNQCRHLPDDLAVVGFDDIPEAAFFHPPLTSIRQNLHQLGTRAIQLLQSMLEAERQEEVFQPEVIWIRPELIVRESSSPS